MADKTDAFLSGMITMGIIVLIIIGTIILSGCTMTRATLPDGTTIERCRFLQDESFSMRYNEGNFIIEDFDSETAEIVAAAIRAALGGGI